MSQFLHDKNILVNLKPKLQSLSHQKLKRIPYI